MQVYIQWQPGCDGGRPEIFHKEYVERRHLSPADVQPPAYTVGNQSGGRGWCGHYGMGKSDRPHPDKSRCGQSGKCGNGDFIDRSCRWRYGICHTVARRYVFLGERSCSGNRFHVANQSADYRRWRSCLLDGGSSEKRNRHGRLYAGRKNRQFGLYACNRACQFKNDRQ